MPPAKPGPSGSDVDEGPAYTRGRRFRARAEAAQRRFRAEVLQAPHGKYGHNLSGDAAAEGLNFTHSAAWRAIQARHAAGKGVDPERSYGNMLSSQAMAFNLLAPLVAMDDGRDKLASALRPFIPELSGVRSVQLEHTPDAEVFGDQGPRSGVDCDVLIEFETVDGALGVLVIATKFVEEGFSTCGHRKPGKNDPCPEDTRVGQDVSACRHTSRNGFRYWERAAQTGSLSLPVLQGQTPCPFGVRIHSDDNGYLVKAGAAVPSQEQATQRWRGFVD